ncbi:MAG: DUF4968 domain-containing protein, partial [Anaerohalosphaera sp.]|nr:DUF4968 domain-containing protein [Anaerohalosphaera sp.]
MVKGIFSQLSTLSRFILTILFVFSFSHAYAEQPEEQQSGQSPGSVIKFSQNQTIQEFSVETDNEYKIRVIFYGPDVFRVSAALKGQFADPLNDPEKAQIVINHTRSGSKITVEETDSQIEFTTDKLILSLQKEDCRLELLDIKDNTIFKELSPMQFGDKTIQTLSTSLDEMYYGG